MSTRRTAWTAAEDRLFDQDLTTREIAQRTGRTLNAVRYRRRQLRTEAEPAQSTSTPMDRFLGRTA